MTKEIPIEVSARHCHLSQRDLEELFGRGFKLTKLRDLTQPGQFAANETVDVKVGTRILQKVRIAGPVRPKTQIELSLTDAFSLGIKRPSIRLSSDLRGTRGAVLTGPKASVKIKQGVIVPWRHIHCNKEELKFLSLKSGQMVSVKIGGKRSLVFQNVQVRVDKGYNLCMHLDTDEGNAAGIIKKGKGIIIKQNSN